MAITITKTLQGTAYTNLYTVVELMSDIGTLAVFSAKAYVSKGHYDDGFLPLLSKQIVINDQPTLAAYRGLVTTNQKAALQAVEGYVVQQSGLLQGGAVS